MRTQESLHIVGDESMPFAGQLQHQLTMLSDGRHSRPDRHNGLTVWATSDRSASVYWSWEMTADGTPVIADPLSIRSNLLFTGPGGEPSADEQLLGINALVRALPWQQEVMDHLARLRLPAVRDVGQQRRRGKPRAPAQAGVSAMAA